MLEDSESTILSDGEGAVAACKSNLERRSYRCHFKEEACSRSGARWEKPERKSKRYQENASL